VIGPIFFHDTINGTRYREQILEVFMNQLDDEELQFGYYEIKSHIFQILEDFWEKYILWYVLRDANG
jgi:hypothetical protein